MHLDILCVSAGVVVSTIVLTYRIVVNPPDTTTPHVLQLLLKYLGSRQCARICEMHRVDLQRTIINLYGFNVTVGLCVYASSSIRSCVKF